MKPLGGIVTNKKSIPDNFRQLATFSAEDLSKFWKIYTINRDVLEKGRRFENLFWRLWGSERINRKFPGTKVASIFAMILEGEAPYERTKYRIPPRPTAPTSRHSLEIECPPTPPPSPIPPEASQQGGQEGTSYLSKLPSELAITASLQQAFPPPPPSPPGPAPPPPSPATPLMRDNATALPTVRKQPPSPNPVPSPTLLLESRASTTRLLLSEDTASLIIKSKGSDIMLKKSKGARPAPGKRKKIEFVAATKGRRNNRPTAPKRKSSSSSNTTVNTAAPSPSNDATTDVARSLPIVQTPRRNQPSTTSAEAGVDAKKGDAVATGWIVDPDFRSQYLDRKRKERLVALTTMKPEVSKTLPTTAVVTRTTAATSTRVRRGKGKNVLVVDELVPLKGLEEEEEPSDDEDAPRIMVAEVKMNGVSEELADELPSNLVRKKSELTLLFEAAKKAGKDKGKKKSKNISVDRER